MTARVQPGVIQDDLNKAAGAHRLDVRARYVDIEPRHARRYDRQQLVRRSLGALRDDDRSRRVARRGAVGREPRAARSTRRTRRSRGAVRVTRWTATLHRDVPRLVAEHETAIRRDFPPFWRKSGGYRLERMMPERGPFNLANLVVGSEGTLAVVVEATVRLVPQPKSVVGVAGHFATVAAAIAVRRGRARVRRRGDRARRSLHPRTWRVGRRHTESSVSVLDGDPGALLVARVLRRHARRGTRMCRTSRSEVARERTRVRGGARRNRATSSRAFASCGRRGSDCSALPGERGERSVAFIEDTAVDPRAARRIHTTACRAARATRAHGRVLWSCVGRLSPHPAVHGSDEARRRAIRCAPLPKRCVRW